MKQCARIAMTKTELIQKIEDGYDILFDVMGRHFTIFTWTNEGIAIDEQHPKDGHPQFFPSAAALVDGFWVDGVPLAELAEKVTITEYT